jgi:hypothetical protein
MALTQPLYDILDPSASCMRLVTIEPGSQCDEIECTLQTTSLHEHEPYEALSYVWGDINTKTPIKLNGCQFPVTTNLMSAIRHLRLDSRRRTMWIDAICINQLDLEERTSQVKQMRDIYSQAVMTVIWLGDEDLTSKMGFEFLREAPVLAEPIENLWDFWYAWDDRVPMQMQMHIQNAAFFSRVLADENLGLLFLSGFFDGILFRPWWTRVWVVQEVAVSKKLIMKCGNDEFSWDRFVEIVCMLNLESKSVTLPNSGSTWFNLFLTQLQGPIKNVVEMSLMKGLYQSGHRVRLPELIAWVKERNATDARDKIFALCGISDSFDDSQLQPAYSTSVKPLDVSCRLVEYSITKYKSLDLICMSQLLVDSDWPSWVPNWESYSKPEPDWENNLSFTCERYYSLLESFARALPKYKGSYSENRRHFSAFLASLDENVKYKLLREPYILEVSGTCVDTVVHLSKKKRYGTGRLSAQLRSWEKVIRKSFRNTKRIKDGDCISDIRIQCYRLEMESAGLKPPRAFIARRNKPQWAYTRREFNSAYIGGGTLVQAYLRTLILDGTSLAKNQIGNKNFKRFLALKVDPEMRAIVISTMSPGYPERRLMVSKKGYIGQVPFNSQAGDLICVLFGCSVPVIIRKVENHHILIGPAYVRGIMKGEAITQLRNGILHEEKFILR